MLANTYAEPLLKCIRDRDRSLALCEPNSPSMVRIGPVVVAIIEILVTDLGMSDAITANMPLLTP